MGSALWTWETAAVAAALLAALVWAARPIQRTSLRMQVRAFREDVWRAMLPTRGEPPFLDMIERYEFDEGRDHDGVMVFKAGIRLRVEATAINRDGDVWSVTWRSVEVDADGFATGDPYETVMELRDAADGTDMRLAYVFYKGEASGPKVWLGRLMRPLMRLNAGHMVREALDKSGASARYEAEHGPAAAPATIVGMRTNRTSLLLFGVGAASFMWMSGVWTGVALLLILVLHELGHVLAMRAYGDKASAFYLVPFMGGVAIGQKPLKSDWQLVIMVLAGPFAGFLSGLGALGMFHVTDNDWFVGVAWLAMIINLMNLLPIPLLDGGQVFMAIFRRYLPAEIVRWISIGLLLAGGAGGAWLGSTLLMVMFGLSAALHAASPAAGHVPVREPLSHQGAAAAAVLFIALAAALMGVGWLIHTGDAYPANPFRLISEGPFD